MSEEVKPRGYADGIPVWCVYDKIVDPAMLNRHPQNPNHHPPAQIELGARIIKGQGWRACITVSNQSGFITRGNGRLDFAFALGANEVPVDYQDYESPEKEWADILADNRLAELAEIDMLKVKDIIDEHLLGHVEVEISGFNPNDLIGKIEVPDLESPGEFKEIDEDMDFDYECPKCGYQWQGKAKPKTDDDGDDDE